MALKANVAFSPLPLLHHFAEVFEEVVGIMWPGAGFRVVLYAEQRQRAMPHPLERVVVQIDMRQIHFALLQRVGIDGVVMIVRRDLHLARAGMLHRMVAAMMAEFQLVSLATQCQADELVSQANPEDRHLAH